MASKAEFIRLVKQFQFSYRRDSWQEFAMELSDYWQRLTPEQMEAVANESYPAAVWRAAWETSTGFGFYE